MDSLRGQADLDGDDGDDFGAIEAPPIIQSQERRMHVRAYNYWVSLLGNRALPSIEDLNPEDTQDFSANSVLLDFSMGLENPAILYLGSALREECDIIGPIERVADVPPRSLLTRLTDHYLQIIANAAPVGFEAEFINQRGVTIQYRGILMPFSSDDETIDFIYGVINWKEAVSDSLRDQLGAEMEAVLANPVQRSAAPIWADGPSATSDFADDERAEEYLDDLVDLTDLDALPEEEMGLDSGDSIAVVQEDDGDFGFDEDPVVAILQDIGELPPVAPAALEVADESALPPLDLADFADPEPAPASAQIEDIDILGSLDDLLAMPDEIAPDVVPEVSDELDLAAFLMPDSAETEDVLAAPETDAADDGFDIDVDDLLAELTPEPVEPPQAAEETPGKEMLEDRPDINDILADIDLDDPVAPKPAPERAPEVSEGFDIDDLLAPLPEESALPQFASLDEEDTAEHAYGDDAMVDSDGELADLLATARSSVAEVGEADARSRAALYRAIGHAHDFALSAQAAPADYADMLADAGIVVQERSPMTAVIKLVFGTDTDKTRIAEYALALDYANATGLSRGELGELLSVYKGGLKGLVQEMRAARKGEAATPAPSPLRRLERAARKLQRARAVEASALPFGELGLAVVIARREEDGSITLVTGLSLEDKTAQKAMIAASKAIGRK